MTRRIVSAIIWISLFYIFKERFNWSEIEAGVVTIICCVVTVGIDIEQTIKQNKDQS